MRCAAALLLNGSAYTAGGAMNKELSLKSGDSSLI
jgi:hypothetical protein